MDSEPNSLFIKEDSDGQKCWSNFQKTYSEDIHNVKEDEEEYREIVK